MVGVPLLDAQREVICYDGAWYLIASLGVIMLVVYAVLVPVILFRSLLKMKVRLLIRHTERRIRRVIRG